MPLPPVLDRFLQAQEPVWPRVIAELRAGHKRTHWMWFVFLQIKGCSSRIALECALRIGMGCKAQSAVIAVAIARIYNAADRPRPQMHTTR